MGSPGSTNSELLRFEEPFYSQQAIAAHLGSFLGAEDGALQLDHWLEDRCATAVNLALRQTIEDIQP